MFNNMSINTAAALFGTALGWTIALILIAFVPPIRHFVVWSWTTPWLWAVAACSCLTAGGIIGWLSDDLF